MSTKNQLLLHLKENKENWVSGELLSNTMTISRSAVWKHIRKLREDGYLIESSPKKGYLFRKSSDLLLEEEIREGLGTKLFGRKNIVYFKETDSTNLRARDLAVSGAPEGTLVISEEQTSGKGRRGRSWFSPSGKGIYTSLILRPAIPPSGAPMIVLMTSIAVAETLFQQTQLEPTIKWPNDILVNGKKIAGILIEIGTEMDAVNHVVVGLGLNVNIPYTCFPDEIRNDSTSVLIETGKSIPRINLICGYLKRCEEYYNMFTNGQFEEITNRWKTFSNIAGKQITVDLPGKRYAGQVSHIDNDGVLVIKNSNGEVHRIFSGDITLLD